jgi:hypothetical protein
MAFLVIGTAIPIYTFCSNYLDSWKFFVATERNPSIEITSLTTMPVKAVAEYVRHNTASTHRVFVWGYQPQIYVLSGRHFASRYFSVAPQTGFVWGTIHQMTGYGYSDPGFAWMYPGLKSFTFKPSDTSQWIHPGSQELLLRDLNSAPPELFIDGNVPGEWPFGNKYPICNFPQFQDFLKRNYRLEKTVLGYQVYRHNSRTFAHPMSLKTQRSTGHENS